MTDALNTNSLSADEPRNQAPVSPSSEAVKPEVPLNNIGIQLQTEPPLLQNLEVQPLNSEPVMPPVSPSPFSVAQENIVKAKNDLRQAEGEPVRAHHAPADKANREQDYQNRSEEWVTARANLKIAEKALKDLKLRTGKTPSKVSKLWKKFTRSISGLFTPRRLTSIDFGITSRLFPSIVAPKDDLEKFKEKEQLLVFEFEHYKKEICSDIDALASNWLKAHPRKKFFDMDFVHFLRKEVKKAKNIRTQQRELDRQQNFGKLKYFEKTNKELIAQVKKLGLPYSYFVSEWRLSYEKEAIAFYGDGFRDFLQEQVNTETIIRNSLRASENLVKAQKGLEFAQNNLATAEENLTFTKQSLEELNTELQSAMKYGDNLGSLREDVATKTEHFKEAQNNKERAEQNLRSTEKALERALSDAQNFVRPEIPKEKGETYFADNQNIRDVVLKFRQKMPEMRTDAAAGTFGAHLKMAPLKYSDEEVSGKPRIGPANSHNVEEEQLLT